jgi:hypothetical protein
VEHAGTINATGRCGSPEVLGACLCHSTDVAAALAANAMTTVNVATLNVGFGGDGIICKQQIYVSAAAHSPSRCNVVAPMLARQGVCVTHYSS